ncbi:YjhS [Escherichia coli]|uniref:YjhS n=1 Tax=Escherichia coli TaxID=562 RepID=A0A376UD14_ECOLX|nr:YjhS [Escherichia coli]
MLRIRALNSWRAAVQDAGRGCLQINDIIPADHCLHDVQDMSTLNHPRAD